MGRHECSGGDSRLPDEKNSELAEMYWPIADPRAARPQPAIRSKDSIISGVNGVVRPSAAGQFPASANAGAVALSAGGRDHRDPEQRAPLSLLSVAVSRARRTRLLAGSPSGPMTRPARSTSTRHPKESIGTRLGPIPRRINGWDKASRSMANGSAIPAIPPWSA